MLAHTYSLKGGWTYGTVHIKVLTLNQLGFVPPENLNLLAVLISVGLVSGDDGELDFWAEAQFGLKQQFGLG